VRILVLGGTSFVGRYVVADALRRGHTVTLFSRGLTGIELFPEAERRTGDRETGDYTALTSGSWDAVVDVSGYQTKHVDQAMDVLGDRVARYVFISSHAVYAPTSAPGSDESFPRREPLRAADVLDNDTYGRCKVACEDDVVARYGDRATLVRPGKVAGPYDTSDTVLYWLRRAVCGGRIALPTVPEHPLQLTDVRDLGYFVNQLVADNRPGAFNAVGPPTTIGELLTTAAGSPVELVRISPDTYPRGFPLLQDDWTARQRDPAKARAAGLPVTPLEETIADTLAWDRDRGEPPLASGPTPAEEQRLLSS
jgi:2'-hydroxyisoflavone reductase